MCVSLNILVCLFALNYKKDTLERDPRGNRIEGIKKINWGTINKYTISMHPSPLQAPSSFFA